MATTTHHQQVGVLGPFTQPHRGATGGDGSFHHHVLRVCPLNGGVEHLTGSVAVSLMLGIGATHGEPIPTGVYW